MVKVIIPCFSLLLTASLFNHSLAQNVTGKVFRDFNANGLQSAINPIEPGVPGVTVKVFKADGTQVGANISTALDGSYSLPVGSTDQYRVEFSNFPTAFFSGPQGTGSGTSTQFVKGGTSANLGINYPSDFCGITNPLLVTPCYENGTPFNNGLKVSNSANDPFIVTIPYNPATDGTGTTENKYLSKGSEVGATWGMAYQRSSKFIFTSALLKRHSGFGEGGPGAIYKIDVSGGSQVTTKFVDLFSDLGVSVGTDPRSLTIPADTLSTTKSAPNHDATAFGLVGKMSLGDIDISDDEKTLWVINTFDRKLYELPIGAPAVKPTTKIAHTLPDPGCVNGVFRPWAIKVWRGKVYVGGVCTAENAGGTAANLKAYIYSFNVGDANADNFTEVTNFPLNYTRGFTSIDGATATSAAWKPWIAKWSDIINPAPGAAAYSQTICPQPILSDIEFDVDGSMILGFMDRSGHQLGNSNYSPDVADTQTYEGTSAGDLLRMGLNVNGTYTLESNATVNGVVSGGTNQTPPQGPNGGEFYWQDMYGKNSDKNLPTIASGGGHQEISLGGLALLPGNNEVVETVFDPASAFRAAGTRWFSNTTGEATKVYQIFGTDAGGGSTTFGKANGLGDLELLCANQPIEVGNRLWNDTDKDGIQDAGEPVLTGVTVELWKGGVKVDTKTTDATTGEYYFTGLSPNSTDYEIRVPNVNGLSKQTQLAGLMPTTAKVGTNNEIDSDAIVTGTYASIAFNTGNAGENNHTLDVGFKCVTPTAKPNGQNVTVCDGSTTFDLPDAKTGSEAETWKVIPSPSTPAAIINATSGLVTGMTTIGKYEFVLTNTATSCTDTVSITIKAMIAAGADKTVCSPATISTVNPSTATQTWSVISKPNGTTPAVATTGNVTGLTTDGVYTFRLTDGTCFDEVQITRKAAPNAGADITTCATAASVNSASVSETWTPVTGNPSPATIDPFGDITGMINVGVYQFKLTSDNGCSDIVAVTKTAGVNLTTKDVGVCVGGILQLTANTTDTGLTFFWKGPVGFTSNQQNPSIADISETNMGVYTVTATSSTGCSATATAKVTFTQITVTQLAGFLNQCVGESLTLRDATVDRKPDEIVGSYMWSGPDGFTASTMNITILAKPDMKQAGVYSLKVTLTNGCFAVATIMTTITKCQKLGNLVWNDVNNDGLNNNGELGVPNVPVKLFDATNPTTSIATTTTGLDGKYLFPNLIPGFYIVEIEAPTGYKTSTGTNGSVTGAYEPAPDPNSPDTNDNDDGSKTSGQFIRSLPIELDNLTEPQNDGDVTNGTKEDKNSNLTIDFGIFQPAQIGDFVWSDTNKNGIHDGGELGVNNVKVNLYLGTGTTPIATFTTGTDGKYLFDNLVQGTYTVEFVKTSIGVGNSFAPKNSPSTTTDKDSDADLTTGKSAQLTLAAGESNLTIDAGIIGDCPGSTVGTIAVPNLCAGQTLTLKATSSDPLATYAWSRTPSGFTASTQEITLPNLVTGSSVFTVLITNSNLCTSALTANVLVNPIPTISVNSVSICSGTTGILTATGATSYSWTGPSGAFTTTTANLSVNQQGVYTITGNSNGCTAIATTSVTVIPLPTVAATGTTLCAGVNGNITATGATTYTWSGPNNFTVSGANPSVTSAGTYTVIGTLNGCTAQATTTVEVKSSIALTVSTTAICKGTSGTLTVSGAATYTWTGPNNFTATGANPTVTMAGTYTVIGTSGGCTAQATTTVTEKALPTVTLVGIEICQGTTGKLTATGASTYAWSGPGTFTNTTAELLVTQSGTYTVIGTSNGCSATATTTVIVNLNPVLTATGAAICLGGSGTISVQPSGLNYYWTGQKGFTSSLQSPIIQNAVDSDGGKYTVLATNDKGCTATATVNVTVGTALTVTPTSNSPVCLGTRLDLSITGGTGAKYLWTSPSGFTTTMQNPFTLSSTNADNGVWTVAVENADGCKGIGSTTVVINPSLTGVTATASAPGCSGGTINLTSTPSGANSYEWTGSPTFTSTVQNPVITSAIADNYTFTVKVTNASGCTALATASTAIYTAPAATASSNSPICVGSPINLSVSTSATQFAWTGPNTFTASLKTPTILKATVANAGVYTVVVTNANSCTAIATTNVIINPLLSGGDDLSICAPVSTAQLTVISGSTWKVELSNPATATVDATGKVSGLTVNGSYVFYITNASGCNDTVKVFRNQKLDAGNDVVICSPTSTAKLLKLNTGQTWKYFTNGQTQPTPTIDANGNVSNLIQDGNYLFILEQAGTIYCADTVAVIRKPAPMAGGDQTVKSGGGICEPLKTAKLQAATTGQVWSVASNSLGFGTVVIDASGSITKMETNGIYTFVLTQGECTDSVKVERIAKPIAGPDVEICSDIKTLKLPNAPTDMAWTSISTNPVGTLINTTTGEVSGLTTVGEYKFILKNLGGCTDTVSIKTKAIPTFDVTPVQATCTIGAANPDAKLIVSSLDLTATYDYSEGITYTGTKTFATGTAITIPVIGLANPTSDKSYTVRVFNSTGCYTDKTVVLRPRVCECKPDVCVPYSFRKTK
jgi:hypothetical protein